MHEFTDANWQQEVLESDKPVVVDFTAPWCGPCKLLGPIVEELAGELAGTVKMGKLNVDDNPQIASKYGIISIPTLLFVKNGTVTDQHVGVLQKDPLKSKIAAFAAS
ncbi:MAG: thioredoxin [Chitinivibrionales bacterium]|nr:thioredoxin [Chitinivibrionales bacterium]MBD3394154.1 thioredoxin [Chitinivibrionales bacterium]